MSNIVNGVKIKIKIAFRSNFPGKIVSGFRSKMTTQ